MLILSNFNCILVFSFILYIIYVILRRRNIISQTYITKDSTVLITGGCFGIGLELIKILFERTKCRIINIDIREDSFKELNNVAKAYDCVIENYRCDLSNIDDMNTTLSKILLKYSKIDILINNAAVSFNKEFTLLSEEEIIKTTNVNLVSPTLICKKILPIMIKNNCGHIVSIASVLSHVTSNHIVKY